MGIVTDHENWRGLLVAGEAEGIPRSAFHIVQEHNRDPEAGRYWLGPDAEVDVCDWRTWNMTAAERADLELRLRRSVPAEWNTPRLVFNWRKPPALEFVRACSEVRDKLWRDLHRRTVSLDAYEAAVDRLGDIHRAVFDDAADHAPFMTELAEILSEARRHPAEQTEIPPPAPGEIEVEEVIAVLRKIIRREAIPRVIFPESGRWRELWHSIGEFEVDGWRIEAWKRNEGMNYVHLAVAPDGRKATYDDFEKREGNPYALLDNEEQDALDDILEET